LLAISLYAHNKQEWLFVNPPKGEVASFPIGAQSKEVDMKKKEAETLKKLRLSRETLRDLKNSEAPKIVGGTIIMSPPSRPPAENDPCAQV